MKITELLNKYEFTNNKLIILFLTAILSLLVATLITTLVKSLLKLINEKFNKKPQDDIKYKRNEII